MNTCRQTSIREIMHAPVVSVSPDDPLSRVRDRLLESRVGGVPVVRDGVMVGIVSRSDFARVPALLDALQGYVQQRQPETNCPSDSTAANFRDGYLDAPVSHFMTTHVVACGPDDSVADVVAQMDDRHVHRVVVVEDERPIGIVTSLDIARLLR